MADILGKTEVSRCRICLNDDLPLNDLFATEVPLMLKFCGFLEVYKGDEATNKICMSCHEAVVQSYNLKQLCISSNIYWQSSLAAQLSREEESNCEDANVDTINFIGDINNESKHSVEKLNTCTDICDSSSTHEKITILINSDSCNNSNDTFSETADTHQEVSVEKNILRSECATCKATFCNDKDLFIHLSIHEDQHKCRVCSKLFPTTKCLKRHIKTHMTTKSHTCKICGKSFVESWDLVKHSRRSHLGIPREKNYNCSMCDQKFTDQYYLRIHERKHSGEKPLKCSDCDKSFYDPRSLNIHIKSHKGIKSYLCNFCGKSFLQKTHLLQHLVVHEKQKPFLCNICDKQFTQWGSLRRHQKVHLSGHICDVCLKSFHTKPTLRKHLEDDHNIKTGNDKKNKT